MIKVLLKSVEEWRGRELDMLKGKRRVGVRYLVDEKGMVEETIYEVKGSKKSGGIWFRSLLVL